MELMVNSNDLKQTEAGMIPSDWSALPLKSVTIDMLQGVNTAVDVPEYVDFGLPMLKANNVIDGRVVFEGADHISERTFLTYSVRFKPNEGDFLFSNIGARLGTGSLLTEHRKCSFAWNVMRIVPNRSRILPQLLAFQINSPKVSEAIKIKQSGSGMGFVPKSVMQEVVIALPPTFSEQEAIAKALSDADALIESLEQLIAKKRQIKKGVMQELLSGERRLPGFEGEWEPKTLGCLGKFRKGRNIPKKALVSSGLPCVLYGQIYTDYDNVAAEFHSFIPADVAKNSEPIEQGDILFAGSGETLEDIGKCFAYIGSTIAYAGGDLVIFTPDNSNSEFLGYLLNSTPVVAQKTKLGQGSTVVHIYTSGLQTIELKVPEKDEQSAIAKVFSDMDSEISGLEKKLNKYKKIKQGMMHNLLTGRIRLV